MQFIITLDENQISPEFKNFCIVNQLDLNKAVQLILDSRSVDFSIDKTDLSFLKFLLKFSEKGVL